jgi:hypothetical protein
MSATKHVLPLAMGMLLILSGCGTRVPDIQENPWSLEGQRLVQAIAASIHCEIRKAVTDVVGNPEYKADWLKSWGAQIQIQLTTDELASVNPTGLYTLTHIFSLMFGGTLSSEATRINTFNYYYTVNEILKQHKCDSILLDNLANNHPIGSFLIQSDLKLEDWLADVVTAYRTGDFSPTTDASVKNSINNNSLAQEIKFVIITSASVAPMWHLLKVTINPTGSLLTASRTRTHDLQITFGPNVVGEKDPSTGKITNSLGVGTPAANSALASQIGLAFSNHTINNLP